MSSPIASGSFDRRADQEPQLLLAQLGEVLQLIDGSARPAPPATRRASGPRSTAAAPRRARAPGRAWLGPARAGASRSAPAASRAPTRSTRAARPARRRPRSRASTTRAASIAEARRVDQLRVADDVVGERDAELRLRGIAVLRELDRRRGGRIAEVQRIERRQARVRRRPADLRHARQLGGLGLRDTRCRSAPRPAHRRRRGGRRAWRPARR